MSNVSNKLLLPFDAEQLGMLTSSVRAAVKKADEEAKKLKEANSDRESIKFYINRSKKLSALSSYLDSFREKALRESNLAKEDLQKFGHVDSGVKKLEAGFVGDLKKETSKPVAQLQPITLPFSAPVEKVIEEESVKPSYSESVAKVPDWVEDMRSQVSEESVEPVSSGDSVNRILHSLKEVNSDNEVSDVKEFFTDLEENPYSPFGLNAEVKRRKQDSRRPTSLLVGRVDGFLTEDGVFRAIVDWGNGKKTKMKLDDLILV